MGGKISLSLFTAVREGCIIFGRGSQQGEAVSFAEEDSLPAEPADLGRKTAAVYLQIIGQLLSVEGDLKAAALVSGVKTTSPTL